MIINGAFSEVDTYTGPIKIVLTDVQNPPTNIDLVPFKVETFDDKEMRYPVDKLLYLPSLVCNSPCFTCSRADKDFCLSCWSDDLSPATYLMQD